ncbi:MAG: hypothetical protein D6693_01160 [Planctomycetota bacterium]|nr:MAG: hypothetical protein D6693_01160 [Planctomycetota bacterium]
MQGLFLLSPWKPILVILPFIGWAWVVSTIYDKDAARWYFKRQAWNTGHMVAAAAAVAAVVLAPNFLIGWPVMVLILAGDLMVYAVLRNKDDRVPEHHKWSFSLADLKARAEARKAAKQQKHVELGLRGPGGVAPVPAKDSPEYEVRVLAERILIDAMEGRAVRFELRPVDQQNYGVIYMIDGVGQAGPTMPKDQAVKVITLLKAAAGMDVKDVRRKQVADLAVERAGGRHVLRLTTSGTAGGMALRGQFEPEEQVKRSLDELGLTDDQLAEARAIIDDRRGVVLIAAGPFEGRTSTLYAVLRSHDAYTTNVQTVELEPVGMIEGVRHNKFDPLEEGAEYATTVRSILRRDPDVLAIAELPDQATAVETTRADLERTRIYVGLNAEGALAAVQTFVKAVGDPRAAGQALHGVTAQKLIRLLCPNCKVEYQPTPEMLKKLGVKPGAVSALYRKGGQVLIRNKPDTCPMCQGTGYFGQAGVFEVFRLGSEERALIAGQDLVGLRSALQKRRLPTIQEAAIRKALEGITSVEEVVRITASSQPKKRPPSKPPAPAAAKQG